MRWSSQRPLWVRVAVGAAGAALVVVVTVAVVKWVPQLLANQDLSGKDAAEDQGRVRTALLALSAGLLASVGAVYTARTFALNRAGQITERFTRAIDQLGSAEIDVRLGGIYALERIARDSRDDHPQVIEVLTAFVREHAPWPPRSSETPGRAKPSSAQGLDVRLAAVDALERIASDSAPQPPRNDHPNDSDNDRTDNASDSAKALEPTPTDVQAAVSVLNRRERSQDPPGFRLDLRHTDLRGARLGEAHLEGAILMEAHLEGATLVEAHLQEANLQEAHLQGANLQEAHLEEAALEGAHLEGAILINAHLDGVFLSEAQRKGADLEGVDFDALREGILSELSDTQGGGEDDKH
jgi:pentapeptide repeat protein